MKLYPLVAFLFGLLIISCETEDDNDSNSNTTNNSNGGSMNSIGITYSVDGIQQPVGDYTFTMISTGGMGSLTIHNSAVSQDSVIMTLITVTQIDSLPNSYVIPNNNGAPDYNFNQMSFSRGSVFDNSGIWNNVGCDPLINPSVNAQLGSFIVTDIDVNNKTISGTFSKELCSGTSTVLVEGEFNDLTYTLLY